MIASNFPSIHIQQAARGILQKKENIGNWNCRTVLARLNASFVEMFSTKWYNLQK